MRSGLCAWAGRSCTWAQKPAQQWGKCQLIIDRIRNSAIALQGVGGLISGGLCVLTSLLGTELALLRAPLGCSICPGSPLDGDLLCHGSISNGAFLDGKGTDPPGPQLSLLYAILPSNSEIKSLT